MNLVIILYDELIDISCLLKSVKQQNNRNHLKENISFNNRNNNFTT